MVQPDPGQKFLPGPITILDPVQAGLFSLGHVRSAISRSGKFPPKILGFLIFLPLGLKKSNQAMSKKTGSKPVRLLIYCGSEAGPISKFNRFFLKD